MSQETYEADAVIVNGELKPVSLVAFRQAMKRFPHEARVLITVKVLRARRSNQQNRYFWGVVIPRCVEFFEAKGHDYDDEMMRDILARKFLPREITDPDTGEVFTAGGHTSDLNTKEFNAFIERVQQWAAPMGLDIPNPNEQERAAS